MILYCYEYFYWPITAHSRRQYEEAFATVQEVLDKVGDELTHDDIYATTEQARVHSTPTANGVRLKQSPWAMLTTIIVIAPYIFLKVFEDNNSILPYTVIASFALYIPIIIKSVKRRKLYHELMARYHKPRRIV